MIVYIELNCIGNRTRERRTIQFTSWNESEELLVISVPFNTIQIVTHHLGNKKSSITVKTLCKIFTLYLIVTHQRQILTHLRQQRSSVRIFQDNYSGTVLYCNKRLSLTRYINHWKLLEKMPVSLFVDTNNNQNW